MRTDRGQQAASALHSNRLPVYLQAEASECGIASLAMIARYHGSDLDLSALRRRFMVSLRGATLADIVRAAGAIEMSCRAVRLEPAVLTRLQLPAILHWNMNHFVVLASVGRRHVVIHDPAVGRRKIGFTDLSKHFTGIALEVFPTLQFHRAAPTKKFGLSSLLLGLRGLGTSLLQIVAIALALELVSLAVPFISQWVVDGSIVSGDRNLLTTIAIVYALLIMVQIALAAMRSWSVLYIGTQINLHWMLGIFSHLLRLPISYFEKRHLGDIVSRFQAVVTIQQALSSTFFASALDGLMGLAAFCAMAFYSAALSAVALAAIMGYVLLRGFLLSPMRAASSESAIKWATQGSHFLESMRNIQTLRLYRMEEHRKSRWLSLVIEALNRDVLVQRLTIVYNSVNSGLFGFERLFVLVIGAQKVLDHNLTLGMLVALLAFNEMLLQRVPTLIDNIYSLQLLNVPIDRVSDIALTEPEPLQQVSTLDFSPPIAITVENVRYRYSEADDYVLKGINFTIEPGRMTAIAGPSGCGKTTLVKIMLGLLKPEDGTVRINGVDIFRRGMAGFRDMVGTVMQEDKLFAGSIADNISCFQEPREQERIIRAARRAAIHDDIVHMPMQYESLVGDMGSAFSGGQRQRILLARALYREPSVLILDEATSALDAANESSVNDALSALHITRVIIAHRSETLARAERVIELCDGVVADDRLNKPRGSASRMRGT